MSVFIHINIYKLWEQVKYGQRVFCTKGQICTKQFVCTKTFLHKDSFLHKNNK